jgi:hypothetical protein
MGQINVKRNASKEGSQALKIPRIEIELGAVQNSLSSLQAELDAAQAQLDEAANLLGGVIRTNTQVLQENAVLPEGYSGYVVGPLRIPYGKFLKVNEGARLVIL